MVDTPFLRAGGWRATADAIAARRILKVARGGAERVGVDLGGQGRGLGATLVGLHHLVERLTGTSQPTVRLYVEADNSAAVKTYQRLGFEVFSVDAAYASNG